MPPKKHFLVSPLNWGLGHATRCVPIIEKLLELKQDVTLAAEGRSHAYLCRQFPELTVLKSPGYGIVYPQSGSMALAMAFQFRKITAGARRERRWLEEVVAERGIDVVISDNRFGFYSRQTYNIYMTHQVQILCPPLLKAFQPVLRLVHGKVISKYHECWIPDYPDEPSLSGALSHNISLQEDCHYIGPLSRLEPRQVVAERYDLAVLLSGPEPQRSIFELIVLEQLERVNLKVIIVRGIPEKEETETRGNLTLVSHQSTAELSETIASAKVILARPGYSTIMDLAATGKQAILIPTPGQTEQEYLAERLHKQGLFFSQSQKRVDLELALREVKAYPGIQYRRDRGDVLEERLNKVIEE